MRRLLLTAAVLFASCFALAQGSSDTPMEDKILAMMNQERAAAGLSALKVDPRLSTVASMHLSEFTKNGEISDQYSGEIPLIDRLRMAEVAFGSAGEIMMKATDLDQVPGQLKDSDPVRRALLNPKYSQAGVAQIKSGNQLFIVANLVQALATLSVDDVENVVVETAQNARKAANVVPLKVWPMHRLRGLDCDMAKKDSVKVAPVNPSVEYPAAIASVGRTLAFTTPDPRMLPPSVQDVGFDPKINVMSVGVCLKNSQTHPQGTYWVVLMFWATR